MALLLQPGAQPMTEDEKADLEAIEVLREEAALELKEQGNEFLKKGKKHYSDALDCYTRAIDQKLGNAITKSILYANRSQANLLLGNYRRALNDAQNAIELSSTNVKACYRGAKAALALNLWSEAAGFVCEGLRQEPANAYLKKLKIEVQQKLTAEAEHKQRSLGTKSRLEALVSAISRRNIRIGKAMYRERTGLQKPYWDGNGILHWPVLLLYCEVMVSDLIEDFPETDMFRSHIEVMFGRDAPPLVWDERNEYRQESIELYYQANVGPVLSEKQLLSSLMEGEVGLEELDLEKLEDDDYNVHISGKEDPKWVKVNDKMTLCEILGRRDHIVPGVPVFYVVASRTTFREEFLSGHWSAPEEFH